MMEAMVTDEELTTLADPAFGQYFLVAEQKLAMLLAAAGIAADDRVLEVGAGAGTIARRIPPCRSLTVIELDERLIPTLRKNAPAANVIQGEALDLIRDIPFDVLIGSLPNWVTESLIDILPELSFRTAVLATGSAANFNRLADMFDVSEVTTITADDFRPPQPTVSRLVRIVRRAEPRPASS
jgi:16S rRNA A1518/A1519 N6-dimethyltransferase RsmA/KsgA/DIM1 with predicted DNA glycosylase/AP lyase activity